MTDLPTPARSTSAASALARGAARAGGERARRVSTPLLGSSAAVPTRPTVAPAPAPAPTSRTPRPMKVQAPPSVTPTEPVLRAEPPTAAPVTPTAAPAMPAAPHTPPAAPATPASPTAPATRRRPRASSDPARALVSQAAARSAAPRRPSAPQAPGVSGTRPTAPIRPTVPPRHRPQPVAKVAPLGPAPVPGPIRPADTEPSSQMRATAGLDLAELLEMAIALLRSVGSAAGLSPDEVEKQVAATLAFVRRRLVGDYSVDAFGFDEDFTDNVYLPLLRPLYSKWFRVEVSGIENLPREGGALLVANHSGTVALDSLMTQVAVHDEHPAHRHLRMLGADLVFETPLIGEVARKSGSTLATQSDAERLLSSGELVGVWPEGFKGIGKPFSERYRLQRFGRGGFVSAAVRTGVPIIPCSIVGAEEIYPIIGNMKTVARLLGVPFAPVTPTWPLLGPLGLIPLPSKWLIEFGEPVHTGHLGPAAAEDPMLVFDLTDRIRESIQQTLHSLLRQRRSAFF